mgnify:CR=1 FL=1|jgi:hypothetical protein
MTRQFGVRKETYDLRWESIGKETNKTKQQKLSDHYVDSMMKIYQVDPLSDLESEPYYRDYRRFHQTMC